MTMISQAPYTTFSSAIQTSITTDYHMHTIFSPDGDDTPQAMAEQAWRLGLTEIAITEHAEWQADWQEPGFPKADDYFEAMEACQTEFAARGLQIYTGIELGNPHQHVTEALALIEQYPFDVVISALHWLDGQNVHMAECFVNRDPYAVLIDYFNELGCMARHFNCDIIAHFDRILWQPTLMGFRFDPYHIENTIRDALFSIASYERCLELNTRHINQPYNWNDALVTIFRWFREAGGQQVVINSDAHRITDVGCHREIGRQILASAGFQSKVQFFNLGTHYALEMPVYQVL